MTQKNRAKREDKLQYCQETLNFVSDKLLKIKSGQIKKTKFTTLDTVIQWETDIHYRVGRPIEISYNYNENKICYFILWEKSTIGGLYSSRTTSWTDEDNLFSCLSELKEFLKNRIDKNIK